MTDKEVEFTLDELTTIQIHMGAIKEKLCNQRRWAEALEYQIIQDKLELIIHEMVIKEAERREE